jgi:hypothetical protein
MRQTLQRCQIPSKSPMRRLIQENLFKKSRWKFPFISKKLVNSTLFAVTILQMSNVICDAKTVILLSITLLYEIGLW